MKYNHRVVVLCKAFALRSCEERGGGVTGPPSNHKAKGRKQVGTCKLSIPRKDEKANFVGFDYGRIPWLICP